LTRITHTHSVCTTIVYNAIHRGALSCLVTLVIASLLNSDLYVIAECLREQRPASQANLQQLARSSGSFSSQSVQAAQERVIGEHETA